MNGSTLQEIYYKKLYYTILKYNRRENAVILLLTTGNALGLLMNFSQ